MFRDGNPRDACYRSGSEETDEHVTQNALWPCVPTLAEGPPRNSLSGRKIGDTALRHAR
jgi:hypothetical protein